MEKEKQSAVVTFFTRGWGFAELESDRTSIYLHHSDILSHKALRAGDKILCHVVLNDHPKNPFRAKEIELVELAPKAAL